MLTDIHFILKVCKNNAIIQVQKKKKKNVVKTAELFFYSRLAYRFMLLDCTVSKMVYNLKAVNKSVKLTPTPNTSNSHNR